MRISPLPCSKELYPIGFQSVSGAGGLRPKPVCQYLLDAMRFARIDRIYIIVRSGKWDIPTYLSDGSAMDLHLAYLIMNLPYGVPYTVDQAYPFVSKSIVVFGFPDIIFEPDDALVQLLAYLRQADADVALGLFPANDPARLDMVDVDSQGRVSTLQLKPEQSELQYTWILAVWTPVFSEFMHDCLSNREGAMTRSDGAANPAQRTELSMGAVFQAATARGLRVVGVPFPDHTFVDIGTPEDLRRATRIFG